MASRETRKLLNDVQQAGGLVLRFTHDRMMQSAVERQFEIVGEAVNQILQIDGATAAKITGGRRIVDSRNRLIHGLRLFLAAIAVLDYILLLLRAHRRLYAALRAGIKGTWRNVFPRIRELHTELPTHSSG